MVDDVQTRLAQRIKQKRRQVGMTQEELAARTGLDYKYVQKIEGKNPPAVRIDTLERVAKALKTTPAELLRFK